MEKLNRFFAKNYYAVYIVCSILSFVVYVLLWQTVGLLALLIACALIYLSAAWLASRSGRLLKNPGQILENQCDPYPYLEEVQRQRDYSGPWTLKYNRTMLEAAALVLVGQPEQAYQMLTPMQEKVFKSRFTALQLVYSGTMVSVCRALDRVYEVENWQAKYMELLPKLKNKRLKQVYTDGLPMALALYHTFRKEHELSQQHLQQFTPKSMYDRVHVAVVSAENNIAMGETEKAKEALRFVVENGNKLHVVILARQMLEELEN